MARPVATTPTITTYLRGKAVYIRFMLGSAIKIQKSTGISLPSDDVRQLDKAGYIKRSAKATAAEDNAVIEAIWDALEMAHRQAGKPVTASAIEAHYTRLLAEGKQLALAKEKAAEKKAELENRHSNLDIIEADIVVDEIAELEIKLLEKRNRRDNLLRYEAPTIDDSLATWLLNYAKRDGANTLKDNTMRTYLSFINTVKRFDPSARIQEVDNVWLSSFQDWMAKEKAVRVTINNKIKLGDTRKNGTIDNYITKIKSCLNYYALWDDLLPEGVVVNQKYKRHEWKLPPKIDNVLTLEEDEILALKELGPFTYRNLRKAQLLFLFMCATSLRYSDAITINRTNIEDGYIKKATQKGERYGTVVYIPLNPISKYVLEHPDVNYDMSKIAIIDDILNANIERLLSMLPSMRKQVTKDNFSGLKKVADKKYYDENGRERLPFRYEAIRSHSGRRTYINIYSDYGVPLAVIAGHTGHTNLKVLQGYLKSRPQLKQHTLNIFNIPKQHNQQI